MTRLNDPITQQFHSSCCSTAAQKKPRTKGGAEFAAQFAESLFVCAVDGPSAGVQQQQDADAQVALGLYGLASESLCAPDAARSSAPCISEKIAEISNAAKLGIMI